MIVGVTLAVNKNQNIVFSGTPSAPGAPTIGTVTVGDGRASVAFNAPASNGGSAVTSYTVTSNPGGLTASGSSSPIVVTGLTNGTSYTFTVTATNSIGTSSSSSQSSSVTPVPGATTDSLIFNLDSGTAPSSGTNWVDAAGNYTATLIKSGTGNYAYTSDHGGGITTTGGIGINGAAISTNLNIPANFTLEIVAKISAATYWASLYGNDSYAGGAGFLGYFNGDAMFTTGSVSGAENFIFAAGAKANINQYIITRTGTTQKFYLNGTLKTKFAGTFTTPSALGTNGLQIGARHPNAGTSATINDPGHGTYYLVRVYNKVLTQSEVTANYNAIKTTYGI